MLAGDEARALRHNYVGTEHFLVALLCEKECLAARVLGSFGITLEEVRAQVIRVVGEGTEPTPAQIPYTKHAVKVTNLAQEEARSLENEFIGTEHLLLGLVGERESRAVGILGEFEASADKIREEVTRAIGGPGPRKTNEGFPPSFDSTVLRHHLEF